MTTFFLICAVVGGTIFTVQFLLTLIGFGAEGLEVDLELPEGFEEAAHGSWLLGAISFRTLVAAAAFFGLGGLATMAATDNPTLSFLVGLACGTAALYGVHATMQALFRLRSDGTARIERAVGALGTVYVPVPEKHTGRGKVQVRMQGRLMEYIAVTGEGERLPTGTAIEVTAVTGPSTVEVSRVHSAPSTEDAAGAAPQQPAGNATP